MWRRFTSRARDPQDPALTRRMPIVTFADERSSASRGSRGAREVAGSSTVGASWSRGAGPWTSTPSRDAWRRIGDRQFQRRQGQAPPCIYCLASDGRSSLDDWFAGLKFGGDREGGRGAGEGSNTVPCRTPRRPARGPRIPDRLGTRISRLFRPRRRRAGDQERVSACFMPQPRCIDRARSVSLDGRLGIDGFSGEFRR
jgi:hypothetical protein